MKPREKVEDATPPSTPPIPTPRKASKPFVTNESEQVSPPSGASKESTQDRPYSGGHKDRPRLPLPTAVQSRSQEQQSAIPSVPNMSTMIASQEPEETDSVYDVPEGQLRPGKSLKMDVLDLGHLQRLSFYFQLISTQFLCVVTPEAS